MFMKLRFLLILSIILLSLSPVLALKETTIYLPAVQETKYGYEGALATLTVNIKEGEGHVYVDTWPLTKIDTQASARMAKQVACDILNLDCSNYNFFYTIRSEAQIVGGPSGGAAMTIATLASLLNTTINNNVLITGTINLDGSIGPVSGIMEKAEAVAEKGNIFLVPYGQSVINVKEITKKQTEPFVNQTNFNTINLKKYAKEHWNLTIKEVKTVQEAFKYFTNYEIRTKEITFKKTKEYQRVMKKLANNLFDYSAELKKECKERLDHSKISYNYERRVAQLCNLSLKEAKENYEKENYYSSASLAFSKAISYKYGINLISLLEAKDKKNFVKNYLKNIEDQIFDANISNIELYAITEERLSETQENVEIAWKHFYNGDYMKAIYYGSLADARLYTATLWRDYSDQFPDYIKITGNLKEVSNNVISEASSILTYLSLTTSNTFLEKAEDLLNKAKNNYNSGNYYAAIIMGLKAEADAELSSEILQSNEDYLIKLHRKRALISINKTNSVIGQSYFEYAEILKKDNKNAALIYYTYAEKLSKLNRLLNKQNIHENITPEKYLSPVSCTCENSTIFFLIGLVLCFFIGFILGKL